MRNRVKYFITDFNKSCMSVFVSTIVSEYHYNIMQNIFYKKIITRHHIYFLLLGNQRISKYLFWFQLIHRQKSAKNYPAWKPNYVRPQARYRAPKGGKLKILGAHIKKNIYISTLVNDLEGEGE